MEDLRGSGWVVGRFFRGVMMRESVIDSEGC